MDILEGAVEGEIGVAEMVALITVVCCQTDKYCGVCIGGEVDGDSGPVFPEKSLIDDVPIRVGRVVGIEVSESTRGYESVGGIENFERETRLTTRGMQWILKDGRVFEYEEVETGQIDKERIFDGLSEGTGSPIAKADGGGMAWGDGT